VQVAIPEPAGSFAKLASTWKTTWSDTGLRRQLFLALAALAAVLPAQAAFLLRVEQRHGVTLPDPVLSALPPHDFTWPLFAIIYVALGAGMGILMWQPRRLVIGIQSYVILVLARIAVMFVTPLEPPAGMIPLKDPFVESVATGTLLTRDLFFSGHTSMLFLLFLVVPVGRAGKAVLLAGTLGVAGGVLCQHVHYTVDVLAAPAFAYTSYSLARRLHPRAA
jgi:hypothetical protein